MEEAAAQKASGSSFSLFEVSDEQRPVLARTMVCLPSVDVEPCSRARATGARELMSALLISIDEQHLAARRRHPTARP